MSDKKDGGAAFPTILEECCNEAIYPIYLSGMSLRDYFAAKSVVSIDDAARICKSIKPSWEEIFKARSFLKYMDADAMIKEREE